jgi:hypothetical protein
LGGRCPHGCPHGFRLAFGFHCRSPPHRPPPSGAARFDRPGRLCGRVPLLPARRAVAGRACLPWPTDEHRRAATGIVQGVGGGGCFKGA